MNRRGVSPRTSMIAALRILAYSKAFDELDGTFEIGAFSCRASFYSFIDAFYKLFGAEYLCCPNEKDLRRILGINDRRVFPGCVGNWDSQHWEWNNCPVAWAGQFKGK